MYTAIIIPYEIPSETVDPAGVYVLTGSDASRCTRRAPPAPLLVTVSAFHWLYASTTCELR